METQVRLDKSEFRVLMVRRQNLLTSLNTLDTRECKDLFQKLYAAAPVALKSVLVEQKVLKHLLEYGNAHLRIDYGHGTPFPDPQAAYKTARELLEAWKSNIQVSLDPPLHGSVRLNLRPA